MAEFELRRCGDAMHECFDRRPVFVPQAVDMGARNHLLGMGGGELVQRLVQIHHQPVQAVAAAVEQAGQSCDLGEADIVAGAEVRIFLDGRETRGRKVALGRVAGLDGGEHGGGIIPDRAAQAGETGRRHLLPGGLGGTVDQRLGGDGVDPGGPALVCQIKPRGARFARMPRRRLQHAQARLDAVIGSETLGDQRRQQQFGLSEFRDDFGFHGSVTCLQGAKEPRPCASFIEADQSRGRHIAAPGPCVTVLAAPSRPSFCQANHFVTTGLDPVVHADSRPRNLSANPMERLVRMDCRPSPAEGLWPAGGSSPAMTKEKRKAERRQTYSPTSAPLRARRASCGTRSPVGVPPRL